MLIVEGPENPVTGNYFVQEITFNKDVNVYYGQQVTQGTRSGTIIGPRLTNSTGIINPAIAEAGKVATSKILIALHGDSSEANHHDPTKAKFVTDEDIAITNKWIQATAGTNGTFTVSETTTAPAQTVKATGTAGDVTKIDAVADKSILVMKLKLANSVNLTEAEVINDKYLAGSLDGKSYTSKEATSAVADTSFKVTDIILPRIRSVQQLCFKGGSGIKSRDTLTEKTSDNSWTINMEGSAEDENAELVIYYQGKRVVGFKADFPQ